MNVGHDTAYLTDAVGGGREGYYRDAVAAGEPPGVWYGAGADELGLAGEVDADLMEAIYKSLLDPRDPASHDRSTWGTAALLSAAHKHYQTPEELYAKALAVEPHAGPERRTELRRESEQKARQATAFVDMTFSPHKSYSLAAAAFEAASNAAFARGDVWEAAHLEEKFRAMEDGIMVGARASIDYLQDRAGYGRVGKHTGGSGRWTDAHRWVVAQFLQHDSRAKDPQLHVHQAVLNRQMCADGKWRALDTTAIKHWRPAAGAIGERVMEEYMSVRAGLRFEVSPDGTVRWLVGVDPELVDQFSKRSNDIDPRTEQLADVFRERYQREPSLHDWTRLAQQATLETRAPKAHHGETVGERMDRWEAETRNRVGANLAAAAEAVLAAAAEPQEAVRFSPSAVAKQALADLGQKRSAFREADVTLAVSHHLPAGMGCGPERVRDLLEGLTQQALGDAVPARQADPVEGAPAEVLLDDGRSAYEPPSARTWTTAEAVLGEQLLRKAAVTRGAAAMRQDEAAAFLTRYAESRVELGYDKAQALMGVVTSGAMLESITAPAGTGKSFLLGAINDAWSSSPGRNMVGLATTQVAAEILAEEGLTTRNVTQWLAAQDRIAAGRPMPSDHELRLTPGTIVTVDEASMTSRQDLVDVQQQCAAAGAKLLAVGDPSQMGPVGPGGALADIAEHGLNYQLTQVFRFKHDWEKQASLDLRDGNRAAVDAYAKHGRLVDGGTREETERAAGKAWLADTLAGKESLLVTATNDEAARLCGQLRAELVGLGKVEQDGVRLGLQGTTAGVGDIVQARRNGWSLAGWEGNTAAPINRRTYEVTGLRNDGGLTVAPIVDRTVQGRVLGDAMQLPAMYVGSHLALGYAATAHAAEGRTVDTCHGINGTGMDAAAALVALTRGTECNTAWTVTRSAPSKDAAPGEVGQVQERTADAVLMDLLERVEVEQGALATIEQAERDAVSTMTKGDRLIDGIGTVLAGRTGAVLDRMVAAGDLSAMDRARLAGDENMWSVDGLLRRVEMTGLDPAEVLENAVRGRDFDGALSAAQVLHSRITKGLGDELRAPVVAQFVDLIPAEVPERWRPWLESHAAAADDRRLELGEQMAAERPQWALEALGDVPEDPIERLDWEDRAGTAAAVRELLGHDDPADALGDAPPAGLAEKNAMWRAGHTALGLPDAGPAERAASEGLLRCQVQAYEREERWAPAYVGHQLESVSLAEARARETATVLGAKAEAVQVDDPERAAMLRAETNVARQQLAAMDEQCKALEKGDADRARWATQNAATRDRAEAARVELAARGIDLAKPPDQTTAAEWVDAHRAEQAVEDPMRQVTDEAELVDPDLDADRVVVDAEPVVGPVVETAVPDIRETAVSDLGEYADPEERRRLPAMADTQDKVTRAQEAVAEMEARVVLDTAADTPELEGAVARWGDGTADVQDQAAEAGVPDAGGEPDYADV